MRDRRMEFEKNNEMENSAIVDMLFDQGNTSDIVLVNENGQELAFKQVYATIKDNVVYCILAPVGEVRFLSEDGAFVFTLTRGQTFTAVKDDALCTQIFSEYYRSLKRGV